MRAVAAGLPLVAWTPLWWPLAARASRVSAGSPAGLEPGQLVVDGLLGGVEGIADLVAEAGRVAEQTVLDLEIEVAAGSDRRVGRQAELLRDTDVESQGHGDPPRGWWEW